MSENDCTWIYMRQTYFMIVLCLRVSSFDFHLLFLFLSSDFLLLLLFPFLIASFGVLCILRVGLVLVFSALRGRGPEKVSAR